MKWKKNAQWHAFGGLSFDVLRYMLRSVIFCSNSSKRLLMIKSYRDKQTETVANGLVARRLPQDMQKVALRKLRQLMAAKVLEDLRLPPGNRLEALERDRAGQHSIRINDQWCICFRWVDGDALDVEIVDYH